ncbi:MAG: hypothetical protein LBQ18_08055 [Campylobacteraceae bacterium]|jgi:hypothetical protein|nr:hypothetical protein [Campylobacteraceae bacterium]
MFNFSIPTLTAGPSEYSTKLASISPKRSSNFINLVSILFVSLLFAGCGEWEGDYVNPYVAGSHAYWFYDADFELLEANYTNPGEVIDLDSKKSKYGTDWYLAQSAVPIEGGFLPNKKTGFYAIPNVIEISDQAELSSVRNNLSGTYIVLEDIELQAGKVGFDATAGWTPIGDETVPFKGIFNGNGRKISGLWIDRPSDNCVGLFGRIEGGNIKKLGVLTDETEGVKGLSKVGIIAGCVETYSTITLSYSAGNVGGDYFIGGIAGNVAFDSKITNAYSKANAVEGNYVGGIAGSIGGSSEVTNTYSIGNISGINYVGGIAGEVTSGAMAINNAAINQNNDGLINVHRIAAIINDLSELVSNNFALDTMNINIDGVVGNDGTPKSDALLKTRLTYEGEIDGDGNGGLGWQFGDNASHPWKIDEGADYPYLYWEDR